MPENWCTITSRAMASTCTVMTLFRSRTHSATLCRELCSIFSRDRLGRFTSVQLSALSVAVCWGGQKACFHSHTDVLDGLCNCSHVPFSLFFSSLQVCETVRMRFEGRGTWWVAGDWVRKYYNRCTGRMAPETNNVASVRISFSLQIKEKRKGEQQLIQDAVVSTGWWWMVVERFESGESF